MNNLRRVLTLNRITVLWLGFCVLLLVSCQPLIPPTPTALPTASTDIFALNQRLGRGVNLGNALEANSEGEWGMVLQEDYFRLIAEAGFTSIRVPIRWRAHAAPQALYTIDAQFLQRVDWVIQQALANHLFVTLDMHHYEEMMQDPDGHRARFLGIWQTLGNIIRTNLRKCSLNYSTNPIPIYTHPGGMLWSKRPLRPSAPPTQHAR